MSPRRVVSKFCRIYAIVSHVTNSVKGYVENSVDCNPCGLVAEKYARASRQVYEFPGSSNSVERREQIYSAGQNGFYVGWARFVGRIAMRRVAVWRYRVVCVRVRFFFFLGRHL